MTRPDASKRHRSHFHQDFFSFSVSFFLAQYENEVGILLVHCGMSRGTSLYSTRDAAAIVMAVGFSMATLITQSEDPAASTATSPMSRLMPLVMAGPRASRVSKAEFPRVYILYDCQVIGIHKILGVGEEGRHQNRLTLTTIDSMSM